MKYASIPACFIFVLWLGPSPSPRPNACFGPMESTEMNPPPTTIKLYQIVSSCIKLRQVVSNCVVSCCVKLCQVVSSYVKMCQDISSCVKLCRAKCMFVRESVKFDFIELLTQLKTSFKFLTNIRCGIYLNVKQNTGHHT